jgi:hypothetical protein
MPSSEGIFIAPPPQRISRHYGQISVEKLQNFWERKEKETEKRVSFVFSDNDYKINHYLCRVKTIESERDNSVVHRR